MKDFDIKKYDIAELKAGVPDCVGLDFTLHQDNTITIAIRPLRNQRETRVVVTTKQMPQTTGELINIVKAATYFAKNTKCTELTVERNGDTLNVAGTGIKARINLNDQKEARS